MAYLAQLKNLNLNNYEAVKRLVSAPDRLKNNLETG
jgi:hypothetical protein